MVKSRPHAHQAFNDDLVTRLQPLLHDAQTINHRADLDRAKLNLLLGVDDVDKLQRLVRTERAIGNQQPFEAASGAGGTLQEAGRSQQELVQQLAVTLGLGVALLPILMILALWLVPRIRFARRAGHARAMLRAGASLDLLALRALTNQKITTIAKVNADAMGAWRRGDEPVMRELAALELESSGVRLRA